jgi:hypothetical protein
MSCMTKQAEMELTLLAGQLRRKWTPPPSRAV